MSEETASMHILVAEDNPADVYLIREALREHAIRCDVSVLKDGAEAIRFIDRFDADEAIPCPDLFLLDLHLPRYDGDEILGRLRASERCGKTPVIVMSSSDSPRDLESAKKHAAVHYFRKPNNLNEFMGLGSIVKTFFTGQSGI